MVEFNSVLLGPCDWTRISPFVASKKNFIVHGEYYNANYMIRRSIQPYIWLNFKPNYTPK